MTTFKDELEQILQKHMCDVIEGDAIGFTVCEYDQAVQAIIELVEREIIGEDEDEGDARLEIHKVPKGVQELHVPRVDFMTRNFLRDKQRAKLRSSSKRG